MSHVAQPSQRWLGERIDIQIVCNRAIAVHTGQALIGTLVANSTQSAIRPHDRRQRARSVTTNLGE